ncbi:MAG: SurA N-terminal domain-containing protein [Acidobacteria bacterium]|nr:SurA N-terminal domain-containing protein [Acidobacteriota bacterium]
MKRYLLEAWWKILFAVSALFAFSAFGYAQGTVTDRLLVLVNRDVITESDVTWALALDPELPTLDLGAENRRAMLERLIDQRLLLQEAEKLPRNEPTEEEITEHISKELIAAFGGNEKFLERMKKVGLEQAMLREIVRRRLEILKYVDFRFRSFIFIKPEEIEQYYRDVEIAQAANKGLGAPVMNEKLRAEIESKLINVRVNSELDRFFDETRAQAQITRLAEIQ